MEALSTTEPRIGSMAARLATVLALGTSKWLDDELRRVAALPGRPAPHYSTVMTGLRQLEAAGMIQVGAVKRGPGVHFRRIAVLPESPLWDALGLRFLVDLGMAVPEWVN